MITINTVQTSLLQLTVDTYLQMITRLSKKNKMVAGGDILENNRSIVVVLAFENTRIIRLTILMLFTFTQRPHIGEHVNQLG